jgi:hypothetical protein
LDGPLTVKSPTARAFGGTPEQQQISTLVVFLMFSTRIHVRTLFESPKLTPHRVANAPAVTQLWVRVGRW